MAALSKIHQAERLADLEVLLRLEVEFRRGSDAADLDVVVLVLADRNVISRQVGDDFQYLLDFGVDLPFDLFALRQKRPFSDATSAISLAANASSFAPLALPISLEAAFTARLGVLQRGEVGAALLVERQDRTCERR